MKKNVLVRLSRFLRPYGFRFLLLLVLLLAGNLLSLAAPLLSGRAVDAVGVRAGGVDFPGGIRELRRDAGLLCPVLSPELRRILPPHPNGPGRFARSPQSRV